MKQALLLVWVEQRQTAVQSAHARSRLARKWIEHHKKARCFNSLWHRNPIVTQASLKYANKEALVARRQMQALRCAACRSMISTALLPEQIAHRRVAGH